MVEVCRIEVDMVVILDVVKRMWYDEFLCLFFVVILCVKDVKYIGLFFEL